MLLSQLFFKTITTDETTRGKVVGIGFSLKSGKIKHLLCSTQSQPQIDLPRTDFAVNTSAITAVADKISLSRIRPIIPKTKTALFPHLPVYSQNGIFLGNLSDGKIKDFVLVQLCTDKNYAFPTSSIAVCHDAIFLRKEKPYPLGQRIPSPMLSQLQGEKTSVTKPLLQRALRQGTLVKLTLSLPPFALLSDEQN